LFGVLTIGGARPGGAAVISLSAIDSGTAAGRTVASAGKAQS